MKWKFYIPALLTVLRIISWGEACPDTAPDYCQTYYDGTAYQCCCTLSTDGTTYIDTCSHDLFIFSLIPDSLSALRLGAFNYEPDATTPEPGTGRGGGFATVYVVTPDSLISLRLGAFNYEPDATTPEPGTGRGGGFATVYVVTPDSLISLRLGAFKYEPPAESVIVSCRHRKLFIFVWEGKVYVLTDPPFGWFTADDTLYFSADSFLWAGLSTHTLDLPDTLQLVPDSLQRRFWYHFLYWTSDYGDTNTSKQWIITVPNTIGLSGVTYTAHFDVDPAIRSRLKGGLWFDPRGRKKGFNPHE
ncbi:MAG TPA: hypothetical protein ENG11_02840 [candidate division Zixibacteria bacterium]|nr:hypothetical protein [candidate division Zixibacteria bacterium]